MKARNTRPKAGKKQGDERGEQAKPALPAKDPSNTNNATNAAQDAEIAREHNTSEDLATEGSR
jgi:hypothetical protein